MLSIKEACKVRVGYSDHVENNYACFASVAIGAEIVEKHFTLDKNMPGPDHSSSLIPSEFKELVNGIRAIEIAMGNGIKIPTDSESKNIFGMKRSIVVLHDMNEGDIINENNIGFKRPANGLSPNHYYTVLGKKIAKNIKKDDALQFDSIVW
jgi:N-acetylneuraminate synthase/N,N'-diacetyllegionaminate synthase